MPFATQFPATATLAEPLAAYHRHTALYEAALHDSINLGLELKMLRASRPDASPVLHPLRLADYERRLAECHANFDYRRNDTYGHQMIARAKLDQAQAQCRQILAEHFGWVVGSPAKSPKGERCVVEAVDLVDIARYISVRVTARLTGRNRQPGTFATHWALNIWSPEPATRATPHIRKLVMRQLETSVAAAA